MGRVTVVVCQYAVGVYRVVVASRRAYTVCYEQHAGGTTNELVTDSFD